ncbi:hypothetical protein LCGC14_2126750, partial [marine sediment metagenome]
QTSDDQKHHSKKKLEARFMRKEGQSECHDGFVNLHVHSELSAIACLMVSIALLEARSV